MEIVQQIIDFVLSLLGLNTSAPKAVAQAKPQRASAAGSLKGLEAVTGAEHIKVAAGDVKVARGGAALIEDEDDGTLLWVDQVDKDLPREQYPDDWGPLGGADDESLVSFLHHELVFTMEMTGDAHAAERKLQGFGYRDAGQFYRVRATVLKHFGTPTGPNLDDTVLDSQRVMSASMKAHQRMHRSNMAAQVDQDPGLLEPVEGVSLELYGQLSAKAAAGLSADQFAALLAEHGLDQATYERVNEGWTQKMQTDTTATLTTMFAQAFQGAGAGQFGAAAQAHAATGYDGTAAAGEAPMSLDQVCEIQGACSAWSKTGQDVNANLAQVFSINAADFSAAHSWWLTQLMADLPRFDEYNRKCEAAEAKYAAAAPASPDADLQF
jgi:hypothetical protein